MNWKLKIKASASVQHSPQMMILHLVKSCKSVLIQTGTHVCAPLLLPAGCNMSQILKRNSSTCQFTQSQSFTQSFMYKAEVAGGFMFLIWHTFPGTTLTSQGTWVPTALMSWRSRDRGLYDPAAANCSGHCKDEIRNHLLAISPA